MKPLQIFIFILYSFTLFAQTSFKHPWLDYSKPIDQRVKLLIDEMTLKEKVSQMVHNSKAIERLDIPQYNWWSEALHGVARSAKATVFPQAIGLAATFDDKLMFEIGNAISDEARAIDNERSRYDKKYIRYTGLTFWSPNVNLFRDPRWGRGQETYGEDPFLTGKLASQFIKGMQGTNSKYLKVAACAKHFAVHSGPEGERHGFNATASKQDMYATYLPAFKSSVDAGVEAVMCAYNRTNDAPCCGSTPLLQNILRKQWNFKGHILSDCWAIADFHNGHHYTKNELESSALALKNGVNLNCGNTYLHLDKAIANGLVDEKILDERLSVLLKTKFKLGMFDPDEINPYSQIGIDVVNSKKHQELALKAASESIVLLQNKNNILPLNKSSNFIYVSGPLADRSLPLLGNYNGLSPNMTTILQGIVKKVSNVTRIQYRAGALLNSKNLGSMNWFSGLAKEADATIAVVGYTSLLEGEEGEAIADSTFGDRPTMKLPNSQMELLRKLANKEKPLVVVICAGSPIDVTEIKELADAIVFAWYPGEKGGDAIADVLFGDISPSGKLPITFPKSVDQLPPFNDYSMEERTYRYMHEEPQYPFGFGLSYSNFNLYNLNITNTNNNYKVEVSVKNNGSIEADEVVQLYVKLLGVNDIIPIQELKGFRRISLLPGKEEEVSFELSKSDFFYINEFGEKTEFTGNAEIFVGNISPGKRSKELGGIILNKKIKVN